MTKKWMILYHTLGAKEGVWFDVESRHWTRRGAVKRAVSFTRFSAHTFGTSHIWKVIRVDELERSEIEVYRGP